MTEIREIGAEDTYRIRKEELRKNVTLSHQMEGDQDPETLHLGLFAEGELVGIASFMRASLPEFEGIQFQLRGMATSQPHQGKGYGRELLLEGERRLLQQGVDILWCNARIRALDFYRKLGFQVLGSVFEVPEIGLHFKMLKRLT